MIHACARPSSVTGNASGWTANISAPAPTNGITWAVVVAVHSVAVRRRRRSSTSGRQWTPWRSGRPSPMVSAATTGSVRNDFGITDSQIHALEKQLGPAAAWQIQGPPMTEDGKDLDVDPSVGQVVNRTIAGSSRITEPVRPQFDGAMVVVERRALLGLTVTQLADYAAIRLLTGADPSHLGNSGAPTILHVLEVPIGGTAPITMTQWDFAFLRGYYDARRNLHTSAQRSAITDSMTKDLRKPQQN